MPTVWSDPDDAPEWSLDQFQRAELRQGETVLDPAKGMLSPVEDKPARQVRLSLDADLLDRLQAEGPGWRRRINEILRRAICA